MSFTNDTIKINSVKFIVARILIILLRLLYEERTYNQDIIYTECNELLEIYELNKQNKREDSIFIDFINEIKISADKIFKERIIN